MFVKFKIFIATMMTFGN